MWINRSVAVIGSLIVLVAAAWACGPFFPTQLLDDRPGTLRSTPTNSFAFEAARLVTPGDALKANEASAWERRDAGAGLSAEERAGLTDQQAGMVQAMREAGDGDAAYAAGEGLREAVRLYTAGAVTYRMANPWCGPREPVSESYGEPAPEPQPCDKDVSAELQQAAARFHAVLALPPDEAAIRSVWAAFMLGQIHAVGAVTSSAELDKAGAAFALARQRAAAGDPDPAGLATASWGEEARLTLTAAGCRWADFYEKTGCIDRIRHADLMRMAALYAEQAARGSAIGRTSLAMIAAWSLRDPDRARIMAADPLVRRLLVAYALARLGDVVEADAASQDGYELELRATGVSGIPDAARGVSRVTVDPRLQALVEAFGSQPGPVDGADRIAALAYRTGHYDLAARFAAQADTAMASWVKAKLALRAGDMAAAATAYAAASRSFPAAPDGLEPASARLIKGELGVLSLSRGEYTEALTSLYQAAQHEAQPVEDSYPSDPGYAEDASYIAERVLTVEELKRFVDVNAPATPAPRAAKPDENNWFRPPPPYADTLRYLLARRLVREGRVADALPYFPAPGDSRFADPEARAHAQAYGMALGRANSAWTDIGQAEALYEAGSLARRHGMEIMGYEQGPDYADSNGMFGWGSGREAVDWSYPPAPQPPTPEARAARDLPGPLVTGDERRRYAASEAAPHRRFHYRYRAVAQAEEAAGLLPARSQAFAAVLCNAAAWLGHGEEAAPDRRRVYVRYLQQGAYVPWGAQFGETCPRPEFAKARMFNAWRGYRSARTWVRHHWYAPLAAAVLLAAGFGVMAIRRRRA
jgi:tetratricopeptide (TPR) repeat protein